ncbi:hypothetical protein NSP_2010 [Nodularia spumigena CCY9414]|nr:hypothetical protein NSP_2010 [Nodularia spumigena CCY9414]
MAVYVIKHTKISPLPIVGSGAFSQNIDEEGKGDSTYPPVNPRPLLPKSHLASNRYS